MITIQWYKLSILVFDSLKDMRLYIADSFKTEEYMLFLYQGWMDLKTINPVLFNEICSTILQKVGIRKIRKNFPVLDKYIIIKDEEPKEHKKYFACKTNIRRLRKNIKLYPNGRWYARITIGTPPTIFNICGNTYESVVEKKKTFYQENNIIYIDD